MKVKTLIKLTHEHKVDFRYINADEHLVIFSKKNESEQILTFINEEDVGIYEIINSLFYLCSETKETLVFSKEEIMNIANKQKHRSRRFESFIKKQSTAMMKIVENIKKDLFVDESHLSFVKTKTDDCYPNKHYILFRSVAVSGIFICIGYNSSKKSFFDCFVHAENELSDLYYMYHHDMKKIQKQFISFIKKDQIMKLKFLFL